MALHDASTIAAVIVEPVVGSAGVLPPPKGYLERLRSICDRHGILLILDEVITGFGRTGESFAAETFGVRPDMLTVAKGLTSGVVPMGAVLVDRAIYEAFMTGPEHAVEFFHGYTYSGTAATAAGLPRSMSTAMKACSRGPGIAPAFENALHSLKGAPHVIDIRNCGLMGAVELAPREGQAGLRALDVFRHCFDAGVLVRTSGDAIVLTPSLIVAENEIARIVDALRAALKAVN